MLDLYTAAKYGPMAVAGFNGSAGAAVRFKIFLPNNCRQGLFTIRATVPVRIRQGTVAAAATATTATYLSANVHYPLLVESPDDCYISLLGATTTAGDLEITLVSDTSTWVLGPCGTGDSVAFVAGTGTLTDAAGYFAAADVGKTIKITGATNAANNGEFTILTVPGATQCTFANASGINETSAFTYQVS